MTCSKVNSVHIIIQHCNVIVLVIRPCTCLTHELASKAPEGEKTIKQIKQAKTSKAGSVSKPSNKTGGRWVTLSSEEAAPDGYLINNRNN